MKYKTQDGQELFIGAKINFKGHEILIDEKIKPTRSMIINDRRVVFLGKTKEGKKWSSDYVWPYD